MLLQAAAKHGLRLIPVLIDFLVAELRLSRVDFIKLDIEGAEREALKGAKVTPFYILTLHSLSSIILAALLTDR